MHGYKQDKKQTFEKDRNCFGLYFGLTWKTKDVEIFSLRAFHCKLFFSLRKATSPDRSKKQIKIYSMVFKKAIYYNHLIVVYSESFF